MTDDLIKRLRGGLAIGEEAADRIEELEKACKEWSEVSQSNYQRAKAAEAKLAKVEVLMSAGFAEYERRLAEMLVVGDAMAASIEGNYYIAGIATKWRDAINIKGEQP